MPDPLTILVIEDEAPIRRFLRASLSAHGYHVLEAVTGQEGLMIAATHRPGLIILDLGLPDLDGIAVTMQLRGWTEVPIIILSAQGHEQAKVTALDAGADDYLTKPFGVEELLARMRVALRHFDRAQAPASDPLVVVGELQIDMAQRRVTLGGQEVHLTPIQYGLLSALARHPGKVVTHTQLLREVWGPHYNSETHYLRVYMGQLRQKLEAQPAKPRYLLTEPGVGYRLAAE